jgi:vacuolar-type H+-ATPase subunit B/Vma2
MRNFKETFVCVKRVLGSSCDVETKTESGGQSYDRVQIKTAQSALGSSFNVKTNNRNWGPELRPSFNKNIAAGFGLKHRR